MLAVNHLDRHIPPRSHCSQQSENPQGGRCFMIAEEKRKTPKPFWKYKILAEFLFDRVYKSKIFLFVCLSLLRDFEYRLFISSQDHARPHILYTDGQRMMSAVIWRCQWHTQRQIQRQIHRQRQIQSASKTQCMLYFFLKSKGFKDFKYDMDMDI